MMRSMAVGKLYMRMVMDDGFEILGPTVAMHGVDGPGRHVVEVIRSGGSRHGERRGWGVLDLWDDGGSGLDVYATLQEAQVAALTERTEFEGDLRFPLPPSN
jgi:hypothetical protein